MDTSDRDNNSKTNDDKDALKAEDVSSDEDAGDQDSNVQQNLRATYEHNLFLPIVRLWSLS